MTPSEFQKFLKENLLIIDGAMGTMIQAYEFGPETYGGEVYQMLSDLLVFSNPNAIKEVHLKYFQSGSNAVETNTFGASPLRLAEFDLSGIDLADFPVREDGVKINDLPLNEFTRLMNQEAVECAKAAIEEYKLDPTYDGRPLFVLGSIGPSNWVLSSTHADLHKGTFEQIQDNFRVQVEGLIDGGVDILLFETQQDMLELKAAVFGAKEAMKNRGVEVPIICQVTVDQFSKMQIFNTDILAALETLQHIGIDAFGINCSIGPDLMTPTVEKLIQHSQIPVSVIPNAGLPQSENGKTVFKLTPAEMGVFAKGFAEMGANILGGCCGTTPDHIRAIADAVKGMKPKKRTLKEGTFLSGPQNLVELDSSKSLIRIGERLNVRGSKKVRDAVESDGPIDQDALEEVITEQIRDLGIEVLDICMDSNQVDTAETLVSVIQGQTVDFKGAFCLDSFDVDALAQAIKVYPGRPLVNSISMEEYTEGVDKVDAVLEVTKAHAPLYIALTTGPKGPAVTAAEKLDLATQIATKARDTHGIPFDSLLIDINAFPIGSESDEGMNFAMESLLSIPQIKKALPGVKVTIGVGNLTNGLAKKPYMRRVLTSVFLDEGRKVGLDAAIINPNHYVPVESLPEADYQLGLKIVLERDMDAFTQLEEIAELKKGGVVKKKTNFDELPAIESVCAKIKEGYKEREKGEIEYDGHNYPFQDRIVFQVKEILLDGIAPLDLINDHLMKSMEELGDGFAEGIVSLPHLLKSADVMKQVMGFLESYMKQGQGGDTGEIEYKGVIVLGTVYQDVHSIGKDLAKTLLENYGYKVIDLGVQVPLQAFIDAAKEHKADAVGLSALLVQTSNHMITLAKMMNEQGLADTPIMIGGAPVSWRHAAYVAMAGEDAKEKMRSNVFYCNSAMDGVNLLNVWMEPNKRENLLADTGEKLAQALERGQKQAAAKEKMYQTLPMREIEPPKALKVTDHEIHKVEMSLRDFVPHINQKLLFTLNWKFGGKGGWEKKGVSQESLEQMLIDWVERIEKEGWFDLSALYSVVPTKTIADKVVILDGNSEVGSLTFNPIIGQGKKDQFTFGQFFNPTGDFVGLQLSTAGPKVDDVINELKVHDQEAAWIVQGLSDRIAEDLSEYTQKIMEEKLTSGKTGLRCSPGYPAMTDIFNNKVIFDLLKADTGLGIRLTEAAEFEPTGSTGAIVTFHPKASFN